MGTGGEEWLCSPCFFRECARGIMPRAVVPCCDVGVSHPCPCSSARKLGITNPDNCRRQRLEVARMMKRLQYRQHLSTSKGLIAIAGAFGTVQASSARHPFSGVEASSWTPEKSQSMVPMYAKA